VYKLSKQELLYTLMGIFLIAVIPTLAVATSILIDHLLHRSVMARFDRLDAAFDRFDAWRDDKALPPSKS
jgi:hypothetical protein